MNQKFIFTCLTLVCMSIIAMASAAPEQKPTTPVPPRLTIAMWDYSWLTGHYPGGWAEDYDKVTDELIERKFNTVRIDVFPLVIHDLLKKGQTKYHIPADPYLNWGFSTIDHDHEMVAELKEFMTITQRKGLFVILSSWGKGPRSQYADRQRFWQAWEAVLDLLMEDGLMDHVLYVDFDQEFPYFSPFAPELKRLGKQPAKTPDTPGEAMEQAGARIGKWNAAQAAFVKTYFESTLAHFHQKYPGVKFTFSLTAFWNEVRQLRPRGMDVLELHIWIKGQLSEYTGFRSIKKDRNPARDYKQYMAGVRKAMENQQPLKKHMKQQLDTARAWADEWNIPLTTTEAWGPWWHMDHPDMEWDWLYDWCEYCMGLSGDYRFWGSTPWNYSHPYWENWKNIEWYQRVNTRFLESKKAD